MALMHYASRQCNDQAKIEKFLAKATVGYLGLAEGNQPYVVPLNFVWWNGSIYFHGADEGRKIKIMNGNASVCFTVCESYGTITDPVPAKTDTAYMSVIFSGKAERVSDLNVATTALQQMVDKYVPGYYNRPLPKSHVQKYRSGNGSSAAIYRIQPDMMTAKENPVDPDKMFYPDRRIGKG